MKEQYQVFEFGNRMIVINREDRSCVGIRKEAFCEKDLDDPNSKLRKSLQKKEWLAKDNELDRMNTVYLLITNKCNLSCEFCSVRADKHNAEHLDSITLDVFDNRIMPLLNEIQPRRVILTGGEPLMNKEVVQIAQEIRKNLPDVYIMMQSNGFLIQDDEMLEKLSESIDSIEISSSHYNELIQLEERIKRIKKQGIKVTLSFLSDGNIDKLRRIIDFVVDEQVGLLLNFISPLGSAIDNDIKILSYEERVQVFKKMAEYILQKKYFDNNFTELFRHVQFSAHQRLCGDVLHQILFALLLHDDLAADHVLIVHLDAAGLGVGGLIAGHLFKTGTLHIPLGQVVEIGQVAGAVHVRDGLHRLPGGQTAGNLHGLVLAHAKADEIRAGVLGDAGQHGVQPVIVVGKPAQAGFQTA